MIEICDCCGEEKVTFKDVADDGRVRLALCNACNEDRLDYFDFLMDEEVEEGLQ